jgi:hypothetical protein
MTKTPCPHCYTAINETDTTCYNCGQAVNLAPPQAAHGCCEHYEESQKLSGKLVLIDGVPVPIENVHAIRRCECDKSNRDNESAWVKVIWLVVGSIIGALITAFAKGEF